MIKIAMIGAGSAVFLKNLLTDILDFPELRSVKIALHDIDAERLETAGMMARWTAQQFKADAVVEEHRDRRAAVDGADFVINMVQIGMQKATEIDWDWLENVGTVGITAGASAPELLVQQVIDELKERYDVTIEETSVTVETTHFKLPRALTA